MSAPEGDVMSGCWLDEFGPDMFEDIAKAEINTGKITVSMLITAKVLWEKDRRYKNQTAK